MEDFTTLNRSDLVSRIAMRQTNLEEQTVEQAIKIMLEQMVEALAANKRIEIRGFGSFTLHVRAPRVGRNPKTGTTVQVGAKAVPHFKPGKALRDLVNEPNI